MKILILVFLVFSYLSFLKANKLSQEDWLYEVYSKYYTEVPDDLWNQLVSSSNQTESYRVQKGDTLWDLSRTFFGDPWYWTKLWSVNKEIPNPHLLKVGQNIQFSLGDQPLQISFEEKKDEIEEEEAEAESVKLFSSANIPPSIPDLVFRYTDSFSIPKVFNHSRIKTDSIFKVRHYISEENNWKTIGRVYGNVKFYRELFLKNKIYVRSRYDLQKGQRFSIAKKTKLQFSNLVSVDVLGEARVLKKVKGSLYLLKLSQIFGTIQTGDHLLDHPVQSVKLNKGQYGERTFRALKIFGKKQGILNQAISMYSEVYLNKGSSSGIQKGDIYPIFKSTDKHPVRKMISYSDQPVGYLQVIHTQKSVSTAIILKIQSLVNVGDLVATRAISSL